VHIILVSSGLGGSKSLTLTHRHMFAGALLTGVLVLALTLGLFWITVRHASELKVQLPLLDSLVKSAQEAQQRKTQEFLRENLNAMAVKVGEMQAQLMRLDALGERLSALAGLKPGEFRFTEVPGRGGAVSSTKDLSMAEFNRQLDQLGRQMENRTDSLGVLESQLFDAKVKKKLMPTMPPVDGSWSASSFGWRIDPFNGMLAMHEGVDFVVDVGTPVYAAAGGVVKFAGMHPQYGYMVEIDHGNDFTTRYAHNSRLLVKEGEVVQRGAKIAESGATGRATGPHVHFEVRYRGVAQNPARFLQAASR
jgi:murein DD-endopeptidase MepM/ murein hydrolase activator NlpD